MVTEKTCKDRVKIAFASRMADIVALYKAKDNTTKELGSLSDYGLCIDVVRAGTFPHQRADYLRWQLSYGGPAEEFRIYKNGDVEFWYMDWFDGASIDLEDQVAEIIINICDVNGFVNE